MLFSIYLIKSSLLVYFKPPASIATYTSEGYVIFTSNKLNLGDKCALQSDICFEDVKYCVISNCIPK